MINGQSAAGNLSNEQLQVLITGVFGDGCFHRYSNKETYNFFYCTNSIHKEYLEFKKKLLDNLCTENISSHVNRGYEEGTIYQVKTRCTPDISSISITAPNELLSMMDELGLALWIYDDGSLHKTKLFYNINTQRFSKEFIENYIVPFLKNKFNIIAIPTIERKKNGKEYWYLRVRKYEGAFIISNILRKYYIHCFDYKIISSETILKWSKLQEQLKSTNIDINTLSPKKLTNMINKMSI